MSNPRPYRELRKGDAIHREFRGDVDSGDLVWHQDERDRRVTVVEGKDWKLQLQDGLPFQMVEGNTYSIPARTWHRLIKGQGSLRIKILEEDMGIKLTESRLRRIVRQEASKLINEVAYVGPDVFEKLKPSIIRYFSDAEEDGVTNSDAYEALLGELDFFYKEMSKEKLRGYY